MKLFQGSRLRSKLTLGIVLAAATVTAFAWPSSTQAALGGDRQTKQYVAGVHGFDHVQFDSLTNVPNMGDERDFLTAKTDGSAGGYYDPINGLKNGDELLVRVYVDNNGDPTLDTKDKAVAKNTRVRVVLPTNLSDNLSATAYVSADNAAPQVIEDGMTFSSAAPVSLQYVKGSATINNKYIDMPLSDNIVTTGVTIGSNDLSGVFKPGFDNAASVTFKVKVTAPPYVMMNTVRKHGSTTFTKSVTAKSGDTVDFNVGFQNTGTAQQSNVIIGDRLPVGLTYVPNSTQWISGHTNGQWTQVTKDDWMTTGGLNTGAYLPQGTVLVRFSATVDDPSKLQCGLSQIVNFGFARPVGQPTLQDSAEVDVTKTCASSTPTPTPTQTATTTQGATTTVTAPDYSCSVFDVKTDNATRTVTITNFNTTTKNGAVFKTVDVDWGENGTAVLSTNTPVGQPHQYAVSSGNGPFVIRATAHFSTPKASDVTATSASCTELVSFTAPATTTTASAQTTATELPNTGAGNVAAIFAVATVIGTLVHRLFLGRRPARR